MMAGLSISQMKNKVDGIFPLKTFCLSLALLILLLIITITVHQLFAAKPVDTSITGKVMATLEAPQKIEEEPIKTVVAEEPKPEPITEEAPHPTETTIEDSIAGLSETTPFGSLPIVRASDGLRSFDAYKTPFKLLGDTKGIISFVMVDFGLSDKLTKSAIETLPAATTFVASPYSEDLQPKVSGARSKGMEVWMGVPMQGTKNSVTLNPGPNTILAGLNAKENISRLNTHLGRATGYAGIAFDTKPSFTEDSPELKAVINAAWTRGLGVAQLESSDTLLNQAAARYNVPFIQGDIWIDGISTKEAITNALAQVEKESLSNGHAVAAFHPSLLTYAIIAEWQKSLAEKHIQLAPLTYAVHISRDSPDKPATPAAKPVETTAASPAEKPTEKTAEAPAPKTEAHTETPKEETPHHESH